MHALLREREERGRLPESKSHRRHHLLQGYPEYLHRWYLPRDTVRSQHGVERHWGRVRRVQGQWDFVQPQGIHDNDRASVTWVRSTFQLFPSPLNFCATRLFHFVEILRVFNVMFCSLLSPFMRVLLRVVRAFLSKVVARSVEIFPRRFFIRVFYLDDFIGWEGNIFVSYKNVSMRM